MDKSEPNRTKSNCSRWHDRLPSVYFVRRMTKFLISSVLFWHLWPRPNQSVGISDPIRPSKHVIKPKNRTANKNPSRKNKWALRVFVQRLPRALLFEWRAPNVDCINLNNRFNGFSFTRCSKIVSLQGIPRVFYVEYYIKITPKT